jgi:opacity protein-like surface antigen
MKNTKALILALALILGSSAAWGQGRFEVTPTIGYRTTGSFEGAVLQLSDFSITDGLAYGLSLGYRVNQMLTMEAFWSRVDSSLTAQVTGSGEQELAKIGTDQIHANFLFFALNDQAKARPYFLLGLGATIANPKATNFSDGDINPSGQTIDPSSASRFSWSLGGGVLVMASERVGVKLQGKWFPTYVNTTSEIWIDWWGYPWVVPVSNYMNQWEFTGGLVFRF